MPELPEVETIKNIISKQVCNSTITDVRVSNVKSLEHISKETFVDGIKGSIIKSICRRGKYFIFDLNTGSLVIHLRMNGKLYVTGDNTSNSYEIATFSLMDGRVLHFDDQRKFAKMAFIPAGEVDTISGVSKLGLEPFDKNLTSDYLKKYWGYKPTTVKEALLEQDVIAGFGNFYSDDLLFICGIHPMKRCINLSDKNYDDLVKTIPEIMKWGIVMDRVTESEYAKLNIEGFEAKRNSYVYGRAGYSCRICGTRIQSMKVSGRTCCFCPSCQHRVKMVPEDVNPDILKEVAKYIGMYITTYGMYEFSLSGEMYEYTWEDFVLEVYKSIMTEDAIVMGDDKSGDSRAVRSHLILDGDESDFEIGLRWIKSQKWKE